MIARSRPAAGVRALKILGIAGLLAGLSMSPGCGASTGLVITIESQHPVPDEVDNLSVEVSGGGREARTYQVPLTAPFPHTMAIATEDVAGTLQVTIEATKGSTIVTSTHIRAELVPSRMLEYFVSL